MPMYMSPDSAQLPTGAPASQPGPPGFGIGPGTGFTTGENQDNVQAMVNRGLLSSDLANQIQAIQAQKDQASLAPYMQLQTNTLASEKGAAPFMPQVGAIGAQADVSKSQDVITQQKLNSINAQYSTLSGIATSLQAKPLDKNNPLDQMRANMYSQHAAQVGVEISPQEFFDPATMDKLSSATTTLLNSAKNLQELRKAGVEGASRVAAAKTEGEYHLAGAKATAAANLEIQARHDATRQAVAETTAAFKANADNAVKMHFEAIAKAGGNISPTEVSSLQYEMYNSLYNNPAMELKKTIAATQPGGLEALQEATREQADQVLEQKLGTSYITAKAKAQQMGIVGGAQAGSNGSISQQPAPTRGNQQSQNNLPAMPTKVGEIFRSPKDGTPMVFQGIGKDGRLMARPAQQSDLAQQPSQ